MFQQPPGGRDNGSYSVIPGVISRMTGIQHLTHAVQQAQSAGEAKPPLARMPIACGCYALMHGGRA